MSLSMMEAYMRNNELDHDGRAVEDIFLELPFVVQVHGIADERTCENNQAFNTTMLALYIHL